MSPNFLDNLVDRTLVIGYSKLGYLVREKLLRGNQWLPLPASALNGKRVLITGASAGLGKQTAIGLAALGATVHLVVRDPHKGERTRTEIYDQIPGARIHVEHCDVSSLDSIRKFAEVFLTSKDIGDQPQIDAIIHNAGVLPAQRQETPEGHELTFATHVLGPFLMTRLLTPVMERSEDPRIIFVSSGGMYAQKLYDQDPQFRQGDYRGAVAYARTKRMQVVLADLWGKHLFSAGIWVASTHPGWAATPGITDSLPGFSKLVKPILRSPEQGVDTTLWLTAAAEVRKQTGQFWHDRAVRPQHYFPYTKESEAQRAHLWEYCWELTEA